MMRLLPIISQAVETAIGSAGEGQENLAQATLRDHALLLEFFARRDGVGAEHAMAIHMAHAMDEMGLEAGRIPDPGVIVEKMSAFSCLFRKNRLQ